MTSTSPRWVCSGEQVGTFYVEREYPCSFTTDSETDAFSHFEQTGHAVDPVETSEVTYRVVFNIYGGGQYATQNISVQATDADTAVRIAQQVANFPAGWIVALESVKVSER